MNARPARLLVRFATLALLSCSSGAPAAAPPLLSADDLRADAAVLGQAYATLHPGLTRYQTEAEARAHLDELDRALDHDQTVLDAFVAFTRYTATLRCGHSYPNFTNQPRAIADLLKAGHDRLPFQFVWIAGRMVVTRNLSDDPRLVRGTVVEAIDDVPVAQVLAALMPLVRADGHNDAKRIDALQVRGFDRIEAFDVYRSLVFPMHGDRFVLRTSIGPVSVAGLTHAQRLATLRTAGNGGDGNPLGWTLTFPAEDTAVLTMPTWIAFNTDWDWKAWVHDVFEKSAARGVTHLVVDLRGNEGGSDVGDELAAYLVERDEPVVPVVRSTRYRRVPDALRPVLYTWDPSFLDWGDAAVGPDARGDYRLRRDTDDADAVIRPRAPHFPGRVDVLVDAADSSATFQFARFVQSRHLATLVGEPTGGNLRGIDGGAFFFVRLPHSRIEVDLPLIAETPGTPMPDRGLLPDVPVSPTVEDIADGTDTVLRAALKRR